MSNAEPAPVAAEPAGAVLGARQDALARALDAALQAERNGSFLDLVRQHPRRARGLARRFERVVMGTAGDALPADALPGTARWLLRWLVARLRPDHEGHLDGIPDAAWLHLSAWRPVLALAAVAGFVAVPDFPRHYRRRSGEPALENLCGLWNVGQSTVYRLMERGRRQMAHALLVPAMDAARRLSLRSAVLWELVRVADDADVGQPAWHERQAERVLRQGDAASALWHLWRAQAWTRFARALAGSASELAVAPETDALVARVLAEPLPPGLAVDLWIAKAALGRERGSTDDELRALERARQLAQASQEPLPQAIAQSELGKFYQSRDIDRAIACYQDAVELLGHRGPVEADADVAAVLVTAYVRLAWQYLQRSDERSRGLLDRAEAIRERIRLPDDVLGVVEQVWAEYWRRAGDHNRSLEHRYRALTIFERLGERRSIISTYLNLCANYNSVGDSDAAIHFAEMVLKEAQLGGVRNESLINAHLALGTAHFAAGRLAESIAAHGEALRLAEAASLRLQRFRAHYNLAEVYFTRFRDGGEVADEQAGDEHVKQALASPDSESTTVAHDATRRLKSEVLGTTSASERTQNLSRLQPAETAVHAGEWAEIERQRVCLSMPDSAEVHARAHLAIAHAYTAIAAKEREAALALIEHNSLRARFVAELDALRQTFERELTREQQLGTAWKQAAADLVDDTRRAALIAHLLKDGAVNKSAYGELCGVSPATASKHLGQLAERGLLVQRGKGPATRYELPSAAAG